MSMPALPLRRSRRGSGCIFESFRFFLSKKTYND
jgi:hypothetical protein